MVTISLSNNASKIFNSVDQTTTQQVAC